MSNYHLNEIITYLRPIEFQKPYQIKNCAKWLVKKGYAKNMLHADRFLYNLQNHDVWRFKSIMSAFYADTERQFKLHKGRKANYYQTSNVNTYGEDLHMYMY